MKPIPFIGQDGRQYLYLPSQIYVRHASMVAKRDFTRPLEKRAPGSWNIVNLRSSEGGFVDNTATVICPDCSTVLSLHGHVIDDDGYVEETVYCYKCEWGTRKLFLSGWPPWRAEA